MPKGPGGQKVHAYFFQGVRRHCFKKHCTSLLMIMGAPVYHGHYFPFSSEIELYLWSINSWHRYICFLWDCTQLSCIWMWFMSDKSKTYFSLICCTDFHLSQWIVTNRKLETSSNVYYIIVRGVKLLTCVFSIYRKFSNNGISPIKDAPLFFILSISKKM